MFLLYDLIFIIFMIGYLPVFCVKIKQADDKRKLLRERFGIYSKEFLMKVKDKRVIWIHAVSVGETLAMKNFFEILKEQFPTYTFVVSTITPTGNRVARTVVGSSGEVIYFPVDISWITGRALQQIKPQVIILMETELWPNLILSAKKCGARIAIINGRLSPGSFRNYYKIQSLLHPVFRKVDLYLTQTERYAKRMQRIGIPKEHIFVTGNMKFDAVSDIHVDVNTLATLVRRYALDPKGKYLVGASTHPKEERFLLEVYCALKEAHPDLKLILVPRHIERVNDIVKEVLSFSLRCAVADHVPLLPEYQGRMCKDVSDVFVMNTIGELKSICALATLVFVGGSIIKHGGQNPLEAIALKKPVITGPNVFNFPGIYDVLVPLSAVKMVTNVSECTAVCHTLLTDERLVKSITDRAYAWLSEHTGASVRNVTHIRELLMDVYPPAQQGHMS